METNIPDRTDAPRRESRTNWLLVAIIVLLAIVVCVQGGILFKMHSEHSRLSKSRTWRERFQQAIQDRQTSPRSPDNQVVFWETTDDLEQIHDRISRLLRSMPTPFGPSLTDNPFAGTAPKHSSGNRLPAQRPFDVNQLQQEIERIFESAYNDSQQSSLLSRVDRGWDMVPTAAAMNIEDRGSNYVVSVALPGYDKQDIAIGMEGRMLIIGATQTPGTQKGAIRNAQGKRQGHFHTQIMLPDDIGSTGALAEFNRDVLSVFIPKTQETNSLVRSIAIR